MNQADIHQVRGEPTLHTIFSRSLKGAHNLGAMNNLRQLIACLVAYL